MEILEAKKEDFNSIYEIEKTSTNEVMSLEELKYEFNENPVAKFMILKDDNGEIVSYIDYWITFDSSTIFKIVTKESARNKGYAKALLSKVIENLIKNGEVLYLTLEVRKSNIFAIKLYESLKFERIVVKEKYYKNGEDAIYMVRGIY